MSTSDLSLSGRRALVCGASAGIGRATALALASLGAEVIALARREERLQALVEELAAAGPATPAYVVADLDRHVRLQESLDALVADGPIHILINNTGGPPGGALLGARPDALIAAFHRHVVASQLMVQALVPGMRESGYGRIINVLSTSVREPIPNLGVSNTIRGAVASWSKTLSRELPPGVTINNILPGYTDTERLSSLKEGVASRSGKSVDQVHATWLSNVPEGRLARPEELAGVIAFLASPAGGYIRGVSLPVDGGRLRSI